MGFSEKIVRKEITKGGKFEHTFIYEGTTGIKRINPLCNCIKYKVNLPKITFSYKTNKTANKIVVITYDNNEVDFLELQTIVKHETQ